MEKQKIFLLIFVSGLLLVQNIGGVSAESCIEELEIEFGVYEIQHLKDNSKLYVRSPYQPTGDDKFVRRSDILFVERIYAKAKYPCQERESVNIQFKRPGSEEWGEDISIFWYFNNTDEYSFELQNMPNFDSIVYKDIYEKEIYPPPGKTLSSEGLWEFKVVEVEKKVSVVNDGWILPGKILVMDRVAVTQLESLRQIRRESKTNTIIVILIGIFTIFFMWRVGNKQIKKMDEHYKKQIKKEDKREEGRQLDLLRTLVTELIFLNGNLEAYKETFSRQGVYPLYELWDMDVSLYLKGLNHKIKNHETISLKENLMVIKDKLTIVNNFKAEAKKLEERGGEKLVQYAIKSNRKQIIKIIDEDLLPIINKSKKFIKTNWNIK